MGSVRASGRAAGTQGAYGPIGLFTPNVTIKADVGQKIFMTATTALAPQFSFDSPKMQLFACYQLVSDPKATWRPFSDEPLPSTSVTVNTPNSNSTSPHEFVRVGFHTATVADSYYVAMCGHQSAGASGGVWMSGGTAKTIAMIVQ